MAQCYFPIPRTDVSPGTTGSFQDVDLSVLVASGASGVALHLTNAGVNDRLVGWQKKGSTDNRTSILLSGNQCYAYFGVDANRTCQIYIHHADVVATLLGYFADDVVFFINSVNKTPGTSGSFQDVDISTDSGGDTAIAGIFQIANSGNRSTGFRMNGSTDGRSQNVQLGGVIVGVDGSEICEVNKSSLESNNIWLLGYMKNTASATFNTNGIDRSLGSTDAYGDLAALPANVVACLYEAVTGNASHLYSLRTKGAVEDSYLSANGRHNWALIQPDGSGLIEGKINDLTGDFFEIGYFTVSAVPSPPRLAMMGVGA